MVSGVDVVSRVSAIASGQWGVLTTQHAEREQVSRLHLARLTDAGVLERVDRGVYAVVASVDEHRALRAAWLALEPSRSADERLADPVAAGVVSHSSAAGLHRLGDLLDDEPEFSVYGRKQTRRSIRLHRAALTPGEVTIIEGLPVTTVERTIADLLRSGQDPEHVAQIVGQGVRRGDIDLQVLANALDPVARRHRQPDGASLLEQLLDLVGLSRAAITRELASTAVGQELVAAGASSAFRSIVASTALTPSRQAHLEAIVLSPAMRAVVGHHGAAGGEDPARHERR